MNGISNTNKNSEPIAEDVESILRSSTIYLSNKTTAGIYTINKVNSNKNNEKNTFHLKDLLSPVYGISFGFLINCQKSIKICLIAKIWGKDKNNYQVQTD